MTGTNDTLTTDKDESMDVTYLQYLGSMDGWSVSRVE